MTPEDDAGAGLKDKLMGLTRRARDVGVAVAILALTALVVARIGGGDRETLAGTARAADGDTLVLDGRRIRLLGMDSPELAQTCTRDCEAWRCGIAARSRLGELLRGGPVNCATEGTDRYGRALARCVVGGADIGERMVREGLAVAYGGYERVEGLAKAERRGIWGADFELPQQYRRRNGGAQEGAHDVRQGPLAGLLGAVGLD
jgi:endonuclease YncB( thermonuclease family)